MHLMDGALSRSAVYSSGGGVLACHGAHDRRAFRRATERVLEVARLVAQLDTLSAVTRPFAVNPITDLFQVLADLRFRPVWCGPVCRSRALVLS
ncbi:hypothetical protein Bca101_010537 [Brassica carinata]